jgi:hypothetical protein
MDRNTAVTTWREVCGSDMIMTLPPTGRLLEEFARRIEAAEREACAQECEKSCTHHGARKGGSDTGDAARRNCAVRIRAR